MKFLCDQCKAKYQIADEKVQGKTLRMKCRKCGHVIEIRAATEAATSGETVQLSALSDDTAAAVLARASAPPPAPKPAAGAAPRPGIAPKPATMPPRAAPLKTPAPRPVSAFGPKQAPGKDPTSKPAASSGALASAFNKQVTTGAPTHIDTPPPPAQQGADVPTEEWYVAIDDVPVGPIRLSELRAKYAQGAARDDSLVWREGYEEWRPLRSLADLHRVVREEVSGQSRGGSLLPNHQRSSPGRTSAPTGSTSRPSPRPAAPAPAARSGNVIPFVQPRGGTAAARKIEEDFDDEATQIAASPFAAPKPEPKPPVAAPRETADPFAPARATSGPFAPTVASQPIAPVPAAVVADVGRADPQRGPSKGAVILIAAACLLIGVVIAVFAIKPKVVEKVVEKRVDVPVAVTTPGGSTENAPATTTAAPETTTTTTAPKVAVKGGGGGGGGGGGNAAPTASVAAPSKKLGNDMGPEGPSLGSGPGTSAGGGGALDGKAVEGVVGSKRVGVRKVCYEPWADKGSASVKVTLKIGADGRVQSSDIASSSGEPAIGQCVQRLSKTWTFPASESGGTFNVPFLFGT